jgi:hypothetical protein
MTLREFIDNKHEKNMNPSLLMIKIIKKFEE